MTMTVRKTNYKKIEQAYFRWLCDLVGADKPGHSILEFAWMLHQKHFVNFVPNDDNRFEDGIKLREYFSSEKLAEEECPCLDGPCTMLEMLIALAQRMDFIVDTPGFGDNTKKWFWILVNNLGLEIFSDDDSFERRDKKYSHNQEIIDRFLRRNYSPSGRGGLFPLIKAYQDQRKIEIWYQLMAWLDENYSV